MVSLIKDLIRDKDLPVLAIIAPDSLPIPPVLGGSIQTIIYDYAKLLKNINIVIVSRAAAGLPKYQLDEHGVGHIHIPSRSFESLEIKNGNDFVLRWNLYIYRACRELKRISPAVVHLHNRPHWVPIVRSALGSTIKIVMTNHNQKINEDNYVLKKMSAILPEIDLAVYPSRRIAEIDLLNRCPEIEKKTAIVANAIDLQIFHRSSIETIRAIKNKFNTGNNKILLYTGRLVGEKGIDKLLEAIPYILKEEKDTVLLVVGSSFFAGAKDTPFVKKLKSLAEQFKQNIIFTGFIDNSKLPEIYSAADIFVSPVNWDDPSPKTIYEAAACECPIVSTRRGGIPEIVEDGSSAVLLDSPYEITELAETIVNLLRDPEVRGEMGAAARARMIERFAPEKIAQAWQEQYLKLLKS